MNKKESFVLGLVSLVLLGIVALLYTGISGPAVRPQNPFIFPKINSWINAGATILLISGYSFIKKQMVPYHKTSMLLAFLLSVTFLVIYVYYHSLGIKVIYGDLNGDAQLSPSEKQISGNLRYVYYLVLLTHIILSVLIIPMVLATIYTAMRKRHAVHKKLAAFTLPIWLYVSISGIVVYHLIEPFYKFVKL